ncbi:hypothetical protein D3C78_1392650 [compost metagenome]
MLEDELIDLLVSFITGSRQKLFSSKLIHSRHPNHFPSEPNTIANFYNIIWVIVEIIINAW